MAGTAVEEAAILTEGQRLAHPERAQRSSSVLDRVQRENLRQEQQRQRHLQTRAIDVHPSWQGGNAHKFRQGDSAGSEQQPRREHSSMPRHEALRSPYIRAARRHNGMATIRLSGLSPAGRAGGLIAHMLRAEQVIQVEFTSVLGSLKGLRSLALANIFLSQHQSALSFAFRPRRYNLPRQPGEGSQELHSSAMLVWTRPLKKTDKNPRKHPTKLAYMDFALDVRKQWKQAANVSIDTAYCMADSIYAQLMAAAHEQMARALRGKRGAAVTQQQASFGASFAAMPSTPSNPTFLAAASSPTFLAAPSHPTFVAVPSAASTPSTAHSPAAPSAPTTTTSSVANSSVATSSSASSSSSSSSSVASTSSVSEVGAPSPASSSGSLTENQEPSTQDPAQSPLQPSSTTEPWAGASQQQQQQQQEQVGSFHGPSSISEGVRSDAQAGRQAASVSPESEAPGTANTQSSSSSSSSSSMQGSLEQQQVQQHGIASDDSSSSGSGSSSDSGQDHHHHQQQQQQHLHASQQQQQQLPPQWQGAVPPGTISMQQAPPVKLNRLVGPLVMNADTSQAVLVFVALKFVQKRLHAERSGLSLSLSVFRNTVAPRVDGRNGFVFELFLMPNELVGRARGGRLWRPPSAPRNRTSKTLPNKKDQKQQGGLHSSATDQGRGHSAYVGPRSTGSEGAGAEGRETGGAGVGEQQQQQQPT